MPLELIHFRDSDKIIRKKKLDRDVKVTLNYLNDVLQGTIQRGELLRQALDEMGWRENGSLNILDGRRYQYKGFKKNLLWTVRLQPMNTSLRAYFGWRSVSGRERSIAVSSC